MAERKYVKEYRVEGYSRDIYTKTIKAARYVAMKESMKEPRPHQIYGRQEEIMNYYPKWVDEITFIRGEGFLQQTGKAKEIGHIYFVTDKQKWMWIPTRRADSVWIDNNGGVVRKLTSKERKRYVGLSR